MDYAGFGPRFAAALLDTLIISPLILLVWWGGDHFRLFQAYYLLPGVAFNLFYRVYLVRKFGGTPGKRLMKLRIVKTSGEFITYREAILRDLPDQLMSLGTSFAVAIAVINLTDAQYFAPSSFTARIGLIMTSAPVWHRPLDISSKIWRWSEFVVMLTNQKRRAIHDFIAGTVVIKEAQQTVAGPDATSLSHV